MNFTGKRVAVIGTGATGVQIIQTIGKSVGHLTVFQRTPNWCAPLNNSKITDEEQAKIKAGCPDLFKLLRTTPGCHVHDADPRSVFEVTEAEREAVSELRYAEPGFGIWQANYRDMLTDLEANKLISTFIAKKIRQRVKNLKTAEVQILKDRGFGMRRVRKRCSDATLTQNVDWVTDLLRDDRTGQNALRGHARSRSGLDRACQ